jgi:hypothetical protein
VKATIIVKDEVNCNIQGLELTDRKNLVNKFKFRLPYAQHLPSVRLGRWDGCMNFFNLGGSSYIALLPEILPYLEERGYDIELDDRRSYSTAFDFAPVTEDVHSQHVWPKGHPQEGQPILLRDYQVEAVNNFLANPQCLQEISTGAGKSMIVMTLCQRCEQYGRTIVIVPNKSLIIQTEADYINCGIDVGVYFGDRKEYNKTHTICTWQSLNILLKDTQNGTVDFTIHDFLEGVVAVIVDECFDGESKVLTPSGYVAIRDIKVGDEVINYSEKTNVFKIDKVVDIHKNLSVSSQEKMYELEFDNGVLIKVTGNHKFLTNLGWCRADELTETHEILTKT